MRGGWVSKLFLRGSVIQFFGQDQHHCVKVVNKNVNYENIEILPKILIPWKKTSVRSNLRNLSPTFAKTKQSQLFCEKRKLLFLHEAWHAPSLVCTQLIVFQPPCPATFQQHFVLYIFYCPIQLFNKTLMPVWYRPSKGCAYIKRIARPNNNQLISTIYLCVTYLEYNNTL